MLSFEELFNYFSSNIQDFLPSSNSEITKTWDWQTPVTVHLSVDSKSK